MIVLTRNLLTNRKTTIVSTKSGPSLEILVQPNIVQLKIQFIIKLWTFYVNKIKDMLFQTCSFKHALPNNVHGKLDELLQRFDNQATESEIVKEKIAKLEDNVCSLEEEVDWLDQYS